MELDCKSQQITQITQIIIDKRKSSNETNETNKRNRRIRRNAQKYIIVQEKDKKKVSVSFCVVCGLKKTTEDAKERKKKIRVLRVIRWQQ